MKLTSLEKLNPRVSLQVTTTFDLDSKDIAYLHSAMEIVQRYITKKETEIKKGYDCERKCSMENAI